MGLHRPHAACARNQHMPTVHPYQDARQHILPWSLPWSLPCPRCQTVEDAREARGGQGSVVRVGAQGSERCWQGAAGGERALRASINTTRQKGEEGGGAWGLQEGGGERERGA
jgi:hypothetical protein